MEKRVLEIEKLKAALGESLTQEEIEKKLKEKIESPSKQEKEDLDDNISNTSDEKIEQELIEENDDLKEDEVKEKTDAEIEKEEENNEESENFEIEVEEISAEKLELLNKRRMEDLKANNSKSSINTIIYIFSFVAVLLMLFAAYLFMNKPVVKEVVVYKNSQPKEIIKEVIKEKVVPIKEIDDKLLKSYFNSTKYKIYKCYDFKVGIATFPNECKKSLKAFLVKNKDSFKLEVTAVVSPDDKAIIKRANLENTSDKIKEYIIRGFSRQRVLETSFYIKDILKDDFILTPVNYYVTSKKLSKGIIIKAYYLEK